MELVQVGRVERKKKIKTKSALIDLTIFSEPGIDKVLACEGLVINLLLQGCQSVSMDSCRAFGGRAGGSFLFRCPFQF